MILYWQDLESRETGRYIFCESSLLFCCLLSLERGDLFALTYEQEKEGGPEKNFEFILWVNFLLRSRDENVDFIKKAELEKAKNEDSKEQTS